MFSPDTGFAVPDFIKIYIERFHQRSLSARSVNDMVKLALVISLLLLLPFHMGVAQDYSEAIQRWPRMTLNLAEDMPLSDIFDSGFRPYRWPGELGNMSIGFRHVMLTTRTRRGAITPVLPMERCEIRVVDPGSMIAEMAFYSPPLTLNEARMEMVKWLPVGSNAVQEMDTFLQNVKADWLHYDLAGSERIEFGTGWKDPDDVRYGIGFMKAYHWDTPLRLVFRIKSTYLQSRKNYRQRSTPVEPPKGYESVTMDLPPDAEWGPDNAYVAVTNEARAPRGSLPPGTKLLDASPDLEKLKKSESKPAAPSPLTQPTTGSVSWWVVLMLILVSGGLAWFALKKRI